MRFTGSVANAEGHWKLALSHISQSKSCKSERGDYDVTKNCTFPAYVIQLGVRICTFNDFWWREHWLQILLVNSKQRKTFSAVHVMNVYRGMVDRECKQFRDIQIFIYVNYFTIVDSFTIVNKNKAHNLIVLTILLLVTSEVLASVRIYALAGDIYMVFLLWSGMEQNASS